MDRRVEDRRAPKRPRGRPTADAQDAAGIERDILAAAREEFVEHGLAGARVDRIARRAGVNKRLLYHYVGNKEAVYSRVMLEAYRDIRAGEAELNLGELPPDEAMARLVGFTFDHFCANPWFIRLLATENMQRARYVSQITDLRALHSPIIQQIRDILDRGVREGRFRSDVESVELYISIAGLSYFFFSNVHTLSVVFDADLAAPASLAARRAHAVDVVLAYLRSRPGLPENNQEVILKADHRARRAKDPSGGR